MTFDEEGYNVLLKDVIRGMRHDQYEESCAHAEEMSWHFYGTTPTKLLERSRPNEADEIKKYRIENYEPETKSAADKAITITSKIFNPNLFSIRWNKDNEQKNELRKYSLEYYPGYNSVVTFTREVLLRKMLADPNGVAVVTVDPPENENERVIPYIKLYGSSSIYFYDDDHYLICTNVKEETFYYFDYYDKNKTIAFMAYIKTEGTSQFVVITEEQKYEYNFDELPVWKLRGLSESKDNGDIIFKSYFVSAAPFWNSAIIHESDVFASYIRHMFPQKYELSEQCTYKHTHEGTVYACRSGKLSLPIGSITCPRCSGSGWEPIGPLGVYKITRDKLNDNGTPIEPIGYINVPIDATKMLEERAKLKIAQGMWAINMDIEDKVGENQSGVAKVIDRSAQYDTLSSIAGTVFDVHLTNYYYFGNKYMFKTEAKARGNTEDTIDKNLPQINKPVHFDVASITEQVENFKVAKESGLDTSYLQIKQIEIQSRDLTTNPDLKLFTVAILELDPLPGMEPDIVDRNVVKGYVKKEDAVIHFNIKAFVERAMLDHKDFFKLDRPKQIEILNGYAEELIKVTEPTLTIPGEEDDTQPTSQPA